jgi:hypothetical protein
MSLSKPACASPFPLPSSCGNGIASRPMTGNTTTHHNGSRQFRGACADRASRAHKPVCREAKHWSHHDRPDDETRRNSHGWQGVRRFVSQADPGHQRRNDTRCKGRYQRRQTQCSKQDLKNEKRSSKRNVVDCCQPSSCAAGDHDSTRLRRQARPVRQPGGKHGACTIVVMNGMRESVFSTALRMETKGLPNRYSAHQPVPATTPQTQSTTKRRNGEDLLTP